MTGKPRIGIVTAKNEEATDANYVTAVERAGGDAVLLRPGDDLPSLESFKGLLFSGGVDIDPKHYGEKLDGTEDIDHERDAFEFKVFEEARRRRIPMLGVCRGFQLLNVCYGGKLVQHMENHRAYKVEGEPTKRSVIHPIEVTKPESKLAQALGATGPVAANSRHHQAVRDTEMAPALVATAYSPDGYVEAIEDPGDHWVVAVQCHPERASEVDPRFTGLFAEFVRRAAEKS